MPESLVMLSPAKRPDPPQHVEWDVKRPRLDFNPQAQSEAVVETEAEPESATKLVLVLEPADFVPAPCGRAFLEVFNVKITDIAGGQPGQLYGTIEGSLGFGFEKQFLFNRQRGEAQRIHPGNCLTLTGPVEEPICADCECRFVLSLMNGDNQVSSGQLEWFYRDYLREYMEKPLTEQIRGTHGSATMYYAVLKNADRAYMKFTLLEPADGKEETLVHGTIVAAMDKPNFAELGSDFESSLFRKDPFDKIKVRAGEDIRLSRPVIAVSQHYPAVLKIDLYGDDKVIAKAELRIRPYESGITSEISIGRVKVSIYWKF